MSVETNLAAVVTRLNAIHSAVDEAAARVDAALSAMPAVNLLRNAACRSLDVHGNLTHPYGVWVPATSSGSAVIEVFDLEDPAVPVVLQDLSREKTKVNPVKVTLTKVAQDDGRVVLLNARPVIGWVSRGFLGVYAEEAGVTLDGRALPAGELITDLRYSNYRDWHIDGFDFRLGGAERVVWLVGPWVCAGRDQVAPLFVLNEELLLNLLTEDAVEGA